MQELTYVKVATDEEEDELKMCKASKDQCDQQSERYISEIRNQSATIDKLKTELSVKNTQIRNLRDKVKQLSESNG